MKNGNQDNPTRETGAPDASPKVAPGGGRPARRNWRLLGYLLLLLVGATAASYVVFRYVLPSVPRELVGTWQVTDGALQGATLEFRWYGTGYATMVKQGKKETAESSVRVRGKRIFMTYKGGPAGLEETVIQTIVSLADDELVIRDQDRVTYHLIRIRY